MIYQLKITLKGSKPPIWRRIQVDSRITFRQLHQIIQIAFDWYDFHLHEFECTPPEGKLPSSVSFNKGKGDEQLDFFFYEFEDQDVAIIGPDNGTLPHSIVFDEKIEILAEWLKRENDKCRYIYDFGDDWQHEILLEKILPPNRGESYPVCIKARKEAPEEDSGGIWNHVSRKERSDQEIAADINAKFRVWGDELKPDPKRVKKRTRKQQTPKKPIPEAAALNPLPSSVRVGTQAPSLEQWKILFELADRFKQLKSWEWMSDVDVFAMADAESGWTGYCSVLGEAGQLYGLAVYIGDEGLISLSKALQGTFDDEDFFEQRSILLSFSHRQSLRQEEYKLIKALGLNFRGKNEWPSFTSYRPGYVPWTLDAEEAAFMTKVLEQAINVCQRVKEHPELLDGEDGTLFARRSSVKEGHLVWEDAWVPAEVSREAPATTLGVNELDLLSLNKEYPQKRGVWEFDLTYFPNGVQDQKGERPYFPVMGIWADSRSGLILHAELAPRGEKHIVFYQQKWLEVMKQMKGIPHTILVKREKAFSVVAPIAEKLGIQLRLVPELSSLEEFMENLFESF